MRATMQEMMPGTEIEISLAARAHNSIRHCASLLSRELGRKYSVSVNWDSRSCKVTRLS